MVTHNSRLPTGWATAVVQTVVQMNPPLDKSGYPDSLQVSFVPMPAVEAGTGVMDVTATRPLAEVKKGYTPFQEGDVLFAKITPCMENGKMSVVPPVKNGLGFGSTEFHVLRPHLGIDPRYIYYFVSSQTFRRNAEHHMTGAVGQRRVPGSHVADHAIPVPPAVEQGRIVSKIDALFSELDKGVENLNTAREQLKVYRQAVLKHAFEGKLTGAWRIQHAPLEPPENLRDRVMRSRELIFETALKQWNASSETGGRSIPKPKKPKTTPLSAKKRADTERLFPLDWARMSVSEVSASIVDCLHSTPTFVSDGWCCIDSTCVEDNKLLRESVRYVDRATYSDRIQRMKPQAKDVIFVREGSKKIGTALVVAFDIDFCLGQRMMMFRLTPTIVPEFFCYYVQSLQFKQQYQPLIGGSASPHLNISDIKAMAVPVCSEAEQREIVIRLDSLLSRIDQLDDEIARQISETRSLRESILKAAFSGQLIEQDPADEPASVLLEKIRATAVTDRTKMNPKRRNSAA